MYKKEKSKKINIDIKNMGVDIDKNEYRQIVLSGENNPEKIFLKQYKNNKK